MGDDVEMTVDQTRHERLSTQIDDLSVSRRRLADARDCVAVSCYGRRRCERFALQIEQSGVGIGCCGHIGPMGSAVSATR